MHRAASVIVGSRQSFSANNSRCKERSHGNDNRELSVRICIHTFWNINKNFVGGTERFILELSKELINLGHSVRVVCTGENNNQVVDGVQVYSRIPDWARAAYSRFGEAKPDLLRQLFCGSPRSLSDLRAFSKFVLDQVDEFEFDILHVNSIASSLFLDSKTPVVVTNHENEQESNNLWGEDSFDFFKLASQEEDSSFHNHSRVVVPTRHYAERYSNFFGRDFIGINQGVNLLSFPFEPNQKPMESERVSILLPSRLEPYQKGHDTALRALAHLVESGVDAEMVFSGLRKDNQHWIKSLSDQANQLNVRNRLDFVAFDDIATAYDAADIVISPERYCSFGLSVTEALASGKFSIISNIPTYVEIASGFGHAVLFEPNDHIALANEISNIVASRAIPRNFDVIEFRKKFDFRECAKKYSDNYLALVQ